MSIVKGVNAIRELSKNSNKDFDDSDRIPKDAWFKIHDGESKKIIFLQEMGEDVEAYSAKNGTLFIAVEHASPANYQVKALCTGDEGDCFGCQQGWNQGRRLYANVLLLDQGKDPVVKVLSQGVGTKSITPALLAALDEIPEGITTHGFTITRSGASKTDTSYTLMPSIKPHTVDVEQFDLYDLENNATRKVPYEKQAEFFGFKEKAEGDSEASGGNEDQVWG